MHLKRLRFRLKKNPVLSHQIRTYLTIKQSSLKLSKTKAATRSSGSSSHRLVCSPTCMHSRKWLLVKVAFPEVFPFFCGNPESKCGSTHEAPMDRSIRECGVWPLGSTFEGRLILIVATFNFTCNFDRWMKPWIVISSEFFVNRR